MIRHGISILSAVPRLRNSCLVLVFSVAFAAAVKADEQIIPLAEDGLWDAAEHRPSITGFADVCIASNDQDHFAFRAQDGEIEAIVEDDRWSLPAGVSGLVDINVGNFHRNYSITYNDLNSVRVRLYQQTEIVDLVRAMDSSTSMIVKAGSAKPKQISLNGSRKVMRAFLTCANIHLPSQGNETNPFGDD